MRGPGFQYAKDMDGTTKVPALLYVIGKNSVTFTIGDLVRINTSGFCDIADANTEAIAGVVSQIVDKNGKSVDADSGTLHDYTMNSANQTSASYQYKIGFIPALPNYLFYNDTSGDLTRTMMFQYFYLTSESQVDGTSGTDTHVEQFRLIERDPDHDADASKGLFQIVQSQFAQEAEDVVA